MRSAIKLEKALTTGLGKKNFTITNYVSHYYYRQNVSSFPLGAFTKRRGGKKIYRAKIEDYFMRNGVKRTIAYHL